MTNFTDDEILRFIEEPKTLPLDWISKSKFREKCNNKEYSIKIEGDLKFKNEENEIESNQYKLLVRQSKLYILDFSAIFSLYPKGTEKTLNIKRYCGKTVQHRNPIEDESLPPDFHIHTITYRYQESDFAGDAYAEVTNRYNNINGAINCLLKDCNFRFASGQQFPLEGWI